MLASGGQEFDAWQEELARATPAERLARQRKNLKSRLGKYTLAVLGSRAAPVRCAVQ